MKVLPPEDLVAKVCVLGWVGKGERGKGGRRRSVGWESEGRRRLELGPQSVLEVGERLESKRRAMISEPAPGVFIVEIA